MMRSMKWLFGVMLANDMSDAASARLGAALVAAGLPQDQATLEWLGGFLAATQMEKISRMDFAGA